MNEVNRYLIRISKWTLLALAMVVTLSIVANAQTDVDVFDEYGQEASYGMDYDGVNPGMDKQCLSYKECPEWDGNPDTKIFYHLMKEPNGTRKVETDFNWNLHVYLCYINKELDSIKGAEYLADPNNGDDPKWEKVRQGLDWFREYEPEAYMKLLD